MRSLVPERCIDPLSRIALGRGCERNAAQALADDSSKAREWRLGVLSGSADAEDSYRRLSPTQSLRLLHDRAIRYSRLRATPIRLRLRLNAREAPCEPEPEQIRRGESSRGNFLLDPQLTKPEHICRLLPGHRWKAFKEIFQR